MLSHHLYPLLRRALFCLPPECSHRISLALLSLKTMVFPSGRGKSLLTEPYRCMGLNFPNRVGLAAGLDKNGDYINALGALGFGFLELGTVTPKPQAGNARPRLFRLSEHCALINRMGFNNKGVDYCVEKLKRHRYPGIIGVNIGKNKSTNNRQAHKDYIYCLERVFAHCDYVTINISSPNTPDLRALQAHDTLSVLLDAIKTRHVQLCQKNNKFLPLVVKVAPDLQETDIDELASLLIRHEIDGVIATNTTIHRDWVEQHPQGREQGGLSGLPLASRATQVVERFAQQLVNKMPIIASGGVVSADIATTKYIAGAQLCQLYTGLIYQGPRLVAETIERERSLR